jgi:hypothetical protein
MQHAEVGAMHNAQKVLLLLLHFEQLRYIQQLHNHHQHVLEHRCSLTFTWFNTKASQALAVAHFAWDGEVDDDKRQRKQPVPDVASKQQPPNG